MMRFSRAVSTTSFVTTVISLATKICSTCIMRRSICESLRQADAARSSEQVVIHRVAHRCRTQSDPQLVVNGISVSQPEKGRLRFGCADCTKQWARWMLWVCSTTWDEERLDIATQGLGRAKWTQEANIAIGTDQDQSSLLDLIALVQFTGEVMQDRARLVFPSRGRFFGHQVGLNHLLIPTREQDRDLTPLSLDRGGFLLGCQHEQDRVFTGEDLEEGLWCCSRTCSNQSVGGAIPRAQRSFVVALIDCDGAMRIGNVDLGEGLGQAMRGSRKRREEDRGQRIAQRHEPRIACQGRLHGEFGSAQ